MSLRARIALLSGAAVGAAIALTAVATFFVVRSQLYDQFDADLLSRTEAISQAVASYPVPSIPVELLDNARVGLLSLSTDQRLQLPEGATVGPPWSQTELAVAGGGVASSLRTVVVDGQSLRVAAVPSRPGTALVVALPTDPVDQTLHDLALILLLIGFLGVVGAAGAGYVVARAGLRPVAELTAAAEGVARTEELSPIRVRGHDEIGRLAKSFNAMLASLDAARLRERQLVADAGHELRTPLTSIRTNLDLLAQSEEAAVHLSPVERASLLNDVRAQIHELGDLVGDLMQLSRGVSSTDSAELVDLSDVANRAIERVQRRAPDLRFTVDIDSWWVEGDPSALERAVTNLLDNAAKWSPASGEVHVILKEGQLTVADNGPGIPEADQLRVFERFYRAPDARGLPGSGLGLAIVAQTAQQHGGQVIATRANSGGAQLTMRLPGTATMPQGNQQIGEPVRPSEMA